MVKNIDLGLSYKMFHNSIVRLTVDWERALSTYKACINIMEDILYKIDESPSKEITGVSFLYRELNNITLICAKIENMTLKSDDLNTESLIFKVRIINEVLENFSEVMDEEVIMEFKEKKEKFLSKIRK